MSFLKHYGTPRHSGRYPWGSGKDPEQRSTSFLGYVESLQKSGMSEKDIADGMGITTSQLRARKSIAKSEARKEATAMAIKLKAKGMSNVAIGKRMNLNESSVRALLDPSLREKADITRATADMLKSTIEKKGVIDIGAGVESHIGISRTKLNTAVELLKEEGYKVHYVKTEQLGTGKYTTIKVLAPSEMTYSEIYKNRSNIKTIKDYSEDGGRSFLGLEPIRSVDSKRVMIRYAEDGGKDKDGVIELRRGVDDISLGNAKYAQVRIGVDGTHYLKGMAIYTDDLPKGVDIIYNSNKTKDVPPEKVFKSMKDDPDNPFGSVVRQQHFITEQGKKTPNSKEMLMMKKSGSDYKDIAKKFNVSEKTVRDAISVKALNIVNEEGDWTEWSKNISSQVLSKQSPVLAKKQLDLARKIKEDEFNELSGLTNPVVKRRLLESFADDADAAAVHLKAAALPRQASHVILPIPSMKPNEIYAPNYRNGEPVVLIRHPHGGTFEIPELVVNNKNPDAQRIMKGAKDAVGIHPKVAEKLSGADFDGDTVLVIPNKDRNVKTSPDLKALKDFDGKALYKLPDSAPKMSARTKQMQMGDVSNLITDMTIKGATPAEIARAVKHSMVVIDAEKHHLDYKQSAIDNNIAQLKSIYQGGPRSGASTLVSKASSEIRVPKRKDAYKIDPKTGEKIYVETGETFVNSAGKTVKKTTTTSRMAEAKDAFSLSSGTKIESIYAEHANALKALANKARLLASQTEGLIYSPSAKQTHASEVASLKAKLNEALKNKPLERQAQLLANKIVDAKRKANPTMEAADLKKIKGQALEEARARTGARKQKIDITDREWEAIQLGAVSTNVLTQIIQNTDLDALKVRSTPRTVKIMTQPKILRAKQMTALGYTTSEIADALGVSTTTVQEVIE